MNLSDSNFTWWDVFLAGSGFLLVTVMVVALCVMYSVFTERKDDDNGK